MAATTTNGTGSVACPCGGRYVTARPLTEHLVADHGIPNRVRAMFLAQQILEGEAIELPPLTPNPELPEPTPRKELPMPPGTVPMSERTCRACGQKGHRRDHCPTQTKSAAAPPSHAETTAAAPGCGYCHRRDGTHSAGCPRRPGAKRATPRAANVSAKRAPKPATGLPSVATPAAATALLRVRLTEELADARAEVRVLERLLTSLPTEGEAR